MFKTTLRASFRVVLGLFSPLSLIVSEEESQETIPSGEPLEIV